MPSPQKVNLARPKNRLVLVPWLSKREGLMEKGLDINPSPDRLYTAAVQHLLKGLAEAAITASASQDTPTPDTVSPV
jgi:hypothetical protein